MSNVIKYKQLKGDDDHSKFDKFEEEEPWIVNENTKNNKRNRNVNYL